LIDDATSEKLDKIELTQRVSRPSCGSASFAAKPTRSLRNASQKNKLAGGPGSKLMQSQFRACHMRLDRHMAN
jgi:hypothetical protein